MVVVLLSPGWSQPLHPSRALGPPFPGCTTWIIAVFQRLFFNFYFYLFIFMILLGYSAGLSPWSNLLWCTVQQMSHYLFSPRFLPIFPTKFSLSQHRDTSLTLPPPNVFYTKKMRRHLPFSQSQISSYGAPLPHLPRWQRTEIFSPAVSSAQVPTLVILTAVFSHLPEIHKAKWLAPVTSLHFPLLP